VSRPASAIVVTILIACVTVDFLNRNLTQPTLPAWFFGVIASLGVWEIDSMVRKVRRRRSVRAEEQAKR
jgi:hypothetical protein